MPAVVALLPLIASIAGIAGTGISLGEALSNQPGTPKAPTPTAAQATPGALASQRATEAATSQAFPNIQAQVGGALSPESYIQLAQLISGTAGSPNAAGATPDLIQKLLTGNTGGPGVTAGSTTTTPGGGGLTNSTFA